jgi:hypothetical protein
MGRAADAFAKACPLEVSSNVFRLFDLSFSVINPKSTSLFKKALAVLGFSARSNSGEAMTPHEIPYFEGWVSCNLLIGNNAHLFSIPFIKLHAVAWIEPFSAVDCVASPRPRGDRAEWRLQCENME